MSSFGWLDTDPAQRRRMLEVVDLFKDQGSVDELGIGSIRDALSDALFPGTSVLHTRLRYVLFIPWLMQKAAHEATPAEMGEQFRNDEYRLIEALIAGGEVVGVIGNRARSDLKRLPSGVYWSALGAWEISTGGFSSETYFRWTADLRALAQRTTRADDVESHDSLPASGLDPHLPRPPAQWLTAVDFRLTAEEEQYLSHRITAAAPGSMLAWLVQNEPSELDRPVWDLGNLTTAPARLQELADHARRFHTAIHGAAVLYNLTLARRIDDEELVDHYLDQAALWRDEILSTGVLEGWDRATWWATIRRQNPNISLQTTSFVNAWLDLIAENRDVTTNPRAKNLIATRERRIKGGRARLANQSALDRWNGASGLTRLDFRWYVASSHLQDLYAARRAA